MATDNIEPVARAICERELRAAPNVSEAELPALVTRYWPVIAAQISVGLRDEDGNEVPHTVDQGIAAWEAWLDEHRQRVIRPTPR